MAQGAFGKNTVYVPVFERGLRRVWPLDGSLLVRLKGTNTAVYWKPGVGYYGNLWNAKDIFKTEAAAWKYWYRDPIKPEERFVVEEER